MINTDALQGRTDVIQAVHSGTWRWRFTSWSSKQVCALDLPFFCTEFLAGIYFYCKQIFSLLIKRIISAVCAALFVWLWCEMHISAVCGTLFLWLMLNAIWRFSSSYLFIDMRSTSQSTSQLRRKHTLTSIRMKIGNGSLYYNNVIYHLIFFNNF